MSAPAEDRAREREHTASVREELDDDRLPSSGNLAVDSERSDREAMVDIQRADRQPYAATLGDFDRVGRIAEATSRHLEGLHGLGVSGGHGLASDVGRHQCGHENG